MHGHRAVCSGSLTVVVVVVGVGQLGMAHPSDGPASSLRMFGHVHRAMCGGGCQFEVLEEHVGARRGGVGGRGGVVKAAAFTDDFIKLKW